MVGLSLEAVCNRLGAPQEVSVSAKSFSFSLIQLVLTTFGVVVTICLLCFLLRQVRAAWCAFAAQQQVWVQLPGQLPTFPAVDIDRGPGHLIRNPGSTSGAPPEIENVPVRHEEVDRRRVDKNGEDFDEHAAARLV